MAKTQKTVWKNQRLVSAAAILVVIAALFFAVNGPDKVRRIYYSNQARSAFNQELKALRPPLDTLGFKGLSVKPAKCSVQNFYLYSTPQLQCTVSAQAYVVIGSSADKKSQFNAAASQLDSDLKKDGWTVSANAAPSMTAWFQGITSGKDYFPDIYSYKIWGSKHCDMDINVAYSNPKPPAFSIQMNCASPVLDKLRDEGV